MEFLIGLVVGFVLGYGIRSLMSRYRRARARLEEDTQTYKWGQRGERQPLKSPAAGAAVLPVLGRCGKTFDVSDYDRPLDLWCVVQTESSPVRAFMGCRRGTGGTSSQSERSRTSLGLRDAVASIATGWLEARQPMGQFRTPVNLYGSSRRDCFVA
jgi:hypothetical protein